MVVGHAERIDLHHIGMMNATDDVVFLQKAIKGARLVAQIWDMPQQLEHDNAAFAFTFRQIDRRHRALRQRAYTTDALDHGGTKAISRQGFGTGAEGSAYPVLQARTILDEIHERAVANFALNDASVGTDIDRCLRTHAIRDGQQQNDRREQQALTEFPNPVDRVATRNVIVHEHHVVAGGMKLTRQRTVLGRHMCDGGQVIHARFEMVLVERSLLRIINDK